MHLSHRLNIFVALLLINMGAGLSYSQDDVAKTTEEAPPSSSQAATATSQPTSAPSENLAGVPPLLGKPNHPSLLRFDELSLELGFEAEWRRRRTTSQTTGAWPYAYRQNDTLRRFSETIGAKASGSAINDSLLTYDLNILGGWSQESYREERPGPDLKHDPSGNLLEYDARVSLFPAGRITGNIFASNLDDRLPRAFLSSLDRRRERYGAELLYNDDLLPMRLTFEDQFERLTDPRKGSTDDQEFRERSLLYEATWRQSDDHQLHLEYQYSDRGDQYSGTRQEYEKTRNYVTLNHLLQFGENSRSRLQTQMRFQDEDGDNARDLFELAPRLRLQHTDELSSNYAAQYLKQRFEQRTIELSRGEIGLTHSLDKWLTSSLGAYGLQQDVDQGDDLTEFGTNGSSEFSHESETGRFTASGSLNYANSRSESDARDGIVIQESHTFRDPLPIRLIQTDVRPLSIIVMDAAGSRVFFYGTDYTLIRLGRYTALVRVPTGRITDGQTVLVSYRYRTDATFELNRTRADLRIQYAFKNGLTPYYAGTYQHEDLDAQRFTQYDPRRVNRHRLGLNFKQKQFSLGSEYEYNDDSIDPYQAGHFTGDVTLWESAPHVVTACGRASYFNFTGTESLDPHDSFLSDIGLAWQATLAADFDINASATYRFENSTIYGRTNGVDVRASLNRKIGEFTLMFEVEYEQLDLPSSEDRNFAASIKLRRGFPLIGSAVP